MNRIALPARRPALRERIVYRRPDGAELYLYVTAGFHPETKQLLEVFIRPRGNVDTDLCRYFDDIGVLISRCLQYGDTLQDLASGMGRLPGEPRAAHSPIGAVIDALIALRQTKISSFSSKALRRSPVGASLSSIRVIVPSTECSATLSIRTITVAGR